MEHQISSWGEVFLKSLQTFLDTLMRALPSIFGAILLLLIGWLLAKLLAFLGYKLLQTIKFDELTKRPPFTEYLQKANISRPSLMIRKLIYWVVLLLFFITAAETMGWKTISNEISSLINYLPRLFSALVVFIIGLYIVSFIRDFIKGATASLGIGAGKFISALVFYLLLAVISLTAAKQAGVDTDIITSNLSLILGSVMLAFAISYGFASRDILSNILASFFSRQMFSEGQIIELEGVSGKIIEISSVFIKIANQDGEIVIPTQRLLRQKVKILKPNPFSE